MLIDKMTVAICQDEGDCWVKTISVVAITTEFAVPADKQTGEPIGSPAVTAIDISEHERTDSMSQWFVCLGLQIPNHLCDGFGNLAHISLKNAF
ncbi:TPA: hypothetical protein MO340_004229 [Salmonella enterica subsp. salamae serovar 35:g,m,s,t:-]|nr:hypothetical protein [Salmonella enterica subsp. salamae serovar 35:g,m,s,t:-]HCA3549701.1 hypothetical protein [Salmonella enterica subsp. salamae serovar 35:g,m,s,t:-]